MDYIFVLGEKLPWVYEAVAQIHSVSPGGSSTKGKESVKRRNAINAYTNAVITLWSKAFSGEHVATRKTIQKHLRKHLNSFSNYVLRNHDKVKSRRTLLREWRSKDENNQLLDILKQTSDVSTFENEEREFYYAQKDNARAGYVSDKVDYEYENERINEEEKQWQIEDEFQKESSFINEENEEFDSPLNSSVNNTSTQSLNRSGLVRVTIQTEDHFTQTDSSTSEQPKIRFQRKCTDAIKTACAQVSSACGISVEMSRVAVKTICKALYGHEFYLNVDETPYNEEVVEPAPKKNRRPISKEDYKLYEYVLPSAKTISDYKHLQASQVECDASLALLNKQQNVKATLHYDTTSRNSIDGEWPCLILNFSDKQKFRLRPLFFAYEDRAQITSLIVETYERLATAATIYTSKNIEAAQLWENTDALMTDAVTKNLGIEDTIPVRLNSTHKPFHTLCKSHTVEKLDKSNLVVLSKLEKELKLRVKFESINPALKPFFRGKEAVAVAGICALLKLVTYDKCANSCSLADEFDYIVEREGKVKHMSLYHQRRFAKLGYSAASILAALPLLQMSLLETEKNNLLVQACRMYSECEFFITELQALAYFTHKVTLPLLNCVEVCDQSKLLQILPKLYSDLKELRTDTLEEFIVVYKHVPVEEPVSELGKEIINMMCLDAAAGIKLQCGREYGFADPSDKVRATELHKLSEEELQGLATNNLDTERDLSKFGRLAQVAKFRNNKFKAKGIRNDMTLYQSGQGQVQRIARKISKILDVRENKWNNQQKDKLKDRIKGKLEKGIKQKDYTTKLLQTCKSWGGPCTTTEELDTVLAKSDIQERVVKVELTYYRNTHKADIIARPELFRLNGISHEERLENLMVLLTDETNDASTATFADLPTNEDALKIIRAEPSSAKAKNIAAHLISINDMCIVVWNVNEDFVWYVGYVKEEKDNEHFVVDHLERVGKSNLFWKYPNTDDTEDVHIDQIIPIKVVGEWNLTQNVRSLKFKLCNSPEIEREFNKH